MSARRPLLRLARWLLLLALLGGVVSCAGKSAARLQAWIDSPADGATVPAGLPVPVVCRATAPKGVAEVLLEVNGAPYRSMPVAGAATTCAVTIDWLPAEPGMFTLQVTAYDSTGVGSSPAAVIVNVEGAASTEPAGTPPAGATPTVTLTPVPDAMATVTPTPYVEPATSTPTLKPSVTPTPFPTPHYWLSVTPSRIQPGECATLQWQVENATAVYLNGEGVAGEGSKEVCPTETTTYTLLIEAPGDNRDASLSLIVQDETAPPIPKPKLPEDEQSVTPAGCPAKVTLDWSPVTDPSGVIYRVGVQRWDGASWGDSREWGPIEDSTFMVEVDCGKGYRWRVRARDGVGNASNWSVWFTFKVGSH